MAVKKKTKNFLLVILASFLTIVLFLFLNKKDTIRLSSVEIKDYQGQKLSSIQDFRENSIKGPQNIDINSYHLSLTGLVQKPQDYSYSDITNRQSYSKVVTLNCIEGWSVTLLWQGVLLKDLFNEAVLDPKANTVIFYAADGYSSSLPLEYVLTKNIILAYKMNGVTFPPERGFPFQVIAEDKLGYKWVKWITKIEISSDNDYQGYWESRGYSNQGDLNQ